MSRTTNLWRWGIGADTARVTVYLLVIKRPHGRIRKFSTASEEWQKGMIGAV